MTELRLLPATRKAGWLALIGAFMTIGLIAYGTWVRTSGSGFGCGPDWPLCNGDVVPGFHGTTGVEFGHRLYAAATVIVTVGAAWFGWLGRKQDPLLAKVTIGALGGILFQAILGAITVMTDLNGNIRLAHLSMAMITLALLTAGAVRGLDLPGTNLPGKRISAAFAVFGGIVVLAGGSIVGNNLGAGCPGVPFCDSRSSTEAAWLHDTHRTLAALLFVGLIALSIWLTRKGAPRIAKALNHSATTLVALQGVIGISMVMQTLPMWLRILHVFVAGLIWWALVTQWLLALKGRSTG